MKLLLLLLLMLLRTAVRQAGKIVDYALLMLILLLLFLEEQGRRIWHDDVVMTVRMIVAVNRVRVRFPQLVVRAGHQLTAAAKSMRRVPPSSASSSVLLSIPELTSATLIIAERQKRLFPIGLKSSPISGGD